jgi:catecholate siderophore receptor
MASSEPRFTLHPLSAALCGALVTLAAWPAQAQAQAQAQNQNQTRTVTLPSVTVTATPEGESSSPKATAPVLDTPQSIQVIPSAVFTEQGARNLTDVLRNTPGISFNAGENGFGTNNNEFSLRGFSTSGNVFVDGVRDSGNFARDAFNLEQVEVIKGPAADNGRGSAGGYVNLETKAPKAENFTTGSIGLGWDEYESKARVRGTLDLNRQFSDSGALRLNLLAEDGGIAGREHAKQRSIGVAPSVSFGLNTPTTLTLSLQHIEQKDRPDWGVPAAMIEGTLRYDPVAGSASRDTFYGLLGDTDDVTSDMVTARIEHRFSPTLKLTNQTRWSKTDRDAFVTAPTGYTPATQLVATQHWGYTRENTSLSNLTNLSNEFTAGGLKHKLAVGLEVVREESKSGRFPTPSGGDVNVFNPNPSRQPGGDLAATQTGLVKIDTVAAYAYDTIEFNPQWQLTGGLRAERYKVSLSSRTAAGTPEGAMDGYQRSETTLGGKLGVVYKPVSNGSIYASYGLSAVPPGSWLSNPDSGRTGNNAFPGWDGQNYEGAKEQKLTNLELGTKWELLDKRLTTTAALFRTERKNVAMRSAGGGVPSGYGEQTVEGIELGVTGHVTPAWAVYGGLVVLDSERRHGPAVDAALSSDYNTATTTSGDELAFTPKTTLNLWTTYRFGSGLTLGGGVQHVSSAWVGRPDTADRVIPNGQSGKVPSYTTFNLMAAYELTSNRRTVCLVAELVGQSRLPGCAAHGAAECGLQVLI